MMPHNRCDPARGSATSPPSLCPAPHAFGALRGPPPVAHHGVAAFRDRHRLGLLIAPCAALAFRSGRIDTALGEAPASKRYGRRRTPSDYCVASVARAGMSPPLSALPASSKVRPAARAVRARLASFRGGGGQNGARATGSLVGRPHASASRLGSCSILVVKNPAVRTAAASPSDFLDTASADDQREGSAALPPRQAIGKPRRGQMPWGGTRVWNH